MDDSIRERIIQALVTRLAIIRTANGFQTNAGANVIRARTAFDPAECPCLIVFPGVETRPNDPDKELVLRVQGAAVYGASSPDVIAEQIRSDVEEALTCPQWTVTYTSGGTYQVVAGNTITGATSGATGYVQSVTLASGTWAGGNAAGTMVIRRKTGTFAAENVNVGATTNVATVSATVPATLQLALCTASLASAIHYTGGGVEEYTQKSDTVVSCHADFKVVYATKRGNPFAQ